MVVLITYYKPHAKRGPFANLLIHLRSEALFLGKHLFSGPLPVNIQYFLGCMFFFSLPWVFHLSTVFAICNAFLTYDQATANSISFMISRSKSAFIHFLNTSFFTVQKMILISKTFLFLF